MPELNWIGKAAVVRHHAEVPYRLLEPVAELSGGAADSGNLIVEGDNLHALKALLPRYAGRVKCIYIDPPYTRATRAGFTTTTSRLRKLSVACGDCGQGGRGFVRHDKWLCMMYPRLMLLKQFLSPDGAIFISIDDNEVASLRLIMDEIFGRENFIANLVWQKRTSPDARLMLSDAHENIVAYSSRKASLVFHKIPLGEKLVAAYKNPDNDPRGPWVSSDYSAQGYRPNQMYKIVTPSGRIVVPPDGNCWKNVEDVFRALDSDKRIWYGKDGNGVPRRKTFLYESEGRSAWTWLDNQEVGHTQEAKQELKQFGDAFGNAFDTPKPTRLIQRILQIATDKDSIVLDSFAGSGTTGHAVLKQNEEDGGTRRFILVEMESKIAREITAERVRRVATGYTDAKGNVVPGLGGGFQYCRLSKEPVFLPGGAVREDVKYLQLAEFVWFLETGCGFSGKTDGPLLGVHEGRAIYLLYNGILKDKTPQGGNVLTGKILEILPPRDGPKVIYAAACRIGPKRLEECGIVFKQTPYALSANV
jgi:site-specific DNA-methyltransferase (adenine-specific)/adenine-specific DNA-methyltransferase